MLVIAAGAVLPIQVGVNSTLRQGIGNPIVAALISFAVRTACLLAYALGAYYVATAILVAPKLGAANLVCLTITAQLFASLQLDHYGLIGFTQHGINTARVACALLLIAGTVMIVKY